MNFGMKKQFRNCIDPKQNWIVFTRCVCADWIRSALWWINFTCRMSNIPRPVIKYRTKFHPNNVIVSRRNFNIKLFQFRILSHLRIFLCFSFHWSHAIKHIDFHLQYIFFPTKSSSLSVNVYLHMVHSIHRMFNAITITFVKAVTLIETITGKNTPFALENSHKTPGKNVHEYKKKSAFKSRCLLQVKFNCQNEFKWL